MEKLVHIDFTCLIQGCDDIGTSFNESCSEFKYTMRGRVFCNDEELDKARIKVLYSFKTKLVYKLCKRLKFQMWFCLRS